MRVMWIVLGWFLLTLQTYAASFDCAKAQSKVEHLICDNLEISKLDDELSVVYKVAVKDNAQTVAIKQTQKQWMKERNDCLKTVCVKLAYEQRLLTLKSVISTHVASPENTQNTGTIQDAVLPINCNPEDQRDNSSIRIQDIAGLYSNSVEGQSAYVGRSEEKISGNNYLAITTLIGNRLRVRLSTKEINGHDCGFDSEALLCGRTIQLMPSQEERAVLDTRKLPIPSLRVTENQIEFIPYADGAYVWGSPYCGAMGYLRHSFLRDTRKLKFDDAVFDQ